MPNFKAACMHQLQIKNAQTSAVAKEGLGRAGIFSSNPASRPLQAPAWTRKCTTNFTRGYRTRCFGVFGIPPKFGKCFMKAEEPGTRSIDAVKQKTTHALEKEALADQPTPRPSRTSAHARFTVIIRFFMNFFKSCYAILQILPIIGNWFKREPVTHSIDAVKRKIGEALHYAVLAGQPTPPPSPKHEHRRIAGDKRVMDLWWNKSIAELVVAFQAPDNVITEVSGQSGQPQCLADVRKLKLKEGEMHVSPSLTGVLDNFLNASAFGELGNLCGDKQPRRIICTGFRVGGSVAIVAAVLLAVDYPLADVRCVTVDSPVITYGRPAFASLYRLLVAFSYHINTNGLLVFADKAKPCPLYGQFVKKEGHLQTNVFDPTAATPGDWSDVSIKKLVSDVVALKDASGSVTKEDTADDLSHKIWDGIRAQIRDPAASEGKLSLKEDTELKRLYAVHPTSREVSLAWTDEAVTPLFNKPLDTVEKLLLVGNRVPALAGMAAAAYHDEKGFEETTGITKLYKFINRNKSLEFDGQCYVVWRPAINTLIVAFRGTGQKKDWLVDANISKESATFLDSIVPGAQVHKGFYDQLDDMFKEIKKKTKSLLAQTHGVSVEHIITTGHSLGGALATVGGPLLAKEFPWADVSVVSFAAPRAGNAEFSQAFATLIGSSMRFQYNYDVVPCVPMSYLGFTHVAPDAYLRSSHPTDGIDNSAELDLYADPPRDLVQYLEDVRDELNLYGDASRDPLKYVKAVCDVLHPHADPPWDPIQCVRGVGKQVGLRQLVHVQAVGEELEANHNIVFRYIGSLVGYMQRLSNEENARVGALKL